MAELNKAKRLTEGALTTALFLVFLLISGYVPILNILAVWFLPIPMMYYIIKWNLKAASIVFFASMTLAFIIAGPVLSTFAIYFLLAGIVAGWCLNRKKSIVFTFAITAVVSIATTFVYYGISIWFFGVDLIASSIEQMKASFKMAGEISSSWGAGSGAAYEQFINTLDQLKMLAPMVLIFSGAISALIILLVATPVLRRLSVNIPQWPPFREWVLPKELVIIFAVVFSYILFFQPTENTPSYQVAINAFYTVVILLQLQGFSFVFYFAHCKKLGKAIPIVTVILCFILKPVLYIIVLLGIIDLGYGLRKRLK